MKHIVDFDSWNELFSNLTLIGYWLKFLLSFSLCHLVNNIVNGLLSFPAVKLFRKSSWVYIEKYPVIVVYKHINFNNSRIENVTTDNQPTSIFECFGGFLIL